LRRNFERNHGSRRDADARCIAALHGGKKGKREAGSTFASRR